MIIKADRKLVNFFKKIKGSATTLRCKVWANGYSQKALLPRWGGKSEFAWAQEAISHRVTLPQWDID